MKKYGFVTLMVILVVVLVYTMTTADKMEEIAAKETQKLQTQISDLHTQSQNAYLALYQDSLPPAQTQTLNRLQAEVNKTDAWIGRLMVRLDSAQDRRSHKKYGFLVEDGTFSQLEARFRFLDSLMQQVATLPDSAQLGFYPIVKHDTWDKKELSGTAYTSTYFLTHWLLKLHKAEEGVLSKMKN